MKEPECSPECKIVVPNPTLVHGSGCPWMAWKHEQAKLASEPKCQHIFEAGSTAGCRICKAAWSDICPVSIEPHHFVKYFSTNFSTNIFENIFECKFCKLTILLERPK
jgi:hypothetical protein